MGKDPRKRSGHKRRQVIARMRSLKLPCAICGKPIDYELTTYIDPKDGREKPHPMRFELDEIVPIALGGSPYEWENLQPAHRICNQRKGKKTMAQVRREQREREMAARGARMRCEAAEGEICTSRRW